MSLFYWTVHCRNERNQEYTVKVPTSFWYVLFLWIGSAKVLVKVLDNGVNVLSMYYHSRLYNKRFNIVAQSASGDPSWDLKELCKQLQQQKLKVINEIRRNRKS
jgi:hypothetical protein